MKSLASLGCEKWLLPILLICILFNDKVWAYGEVDTFMLGWQAFFVKAHGNSEHVEAMLNDEAKEHGLALLALKASAEKDWRKKVWELKKKMPWHLFILDCKYFVEKLFTDNHANEQHKDEIFSFKARHIWQLSLVDTGELDQFLLMDLYTKHLKEKSKTRQSELYLSDDPAIMHSSLPFTRALVVGIGPIGLYSTLQLFMAGIETIVVSDSWHSVRNPICLLEPKFMVHLRLLFGHKFNGLSGQTHNFLDLIQSGQNWALKCQDLVAGKMKGKMPPKHYGIAVIDKASAGEHIFANGHGPYSKQLHFELTEMKEFLPEGAFDKVIEQNPNLAKIYANFDQMLLAKSVLQYHVRIQEVGPLIYFVVSTPWALEQLANGLESHKQKHWDDPAMVKKYHKLKQQIERIWFLAVFKFCLSKSAPTFSGKIKFNLDENGNIVHTLDQWKDKSKHGQQKDPHNGQTLLFVDPANSSTFPVEFKETKVPARYTTQDYKSLLLTLGDSLATPNVLVENGLSIGLSSVENTVNLLKEFQQDSKANRSKLLGTLTYKLDASKKMIMQEASDFVKKSESVDENAKAEGKGQKTDMTDDEHFYPYGSSD